MKSNPLLSFSEMGYITPLISATNCTYDSTKYVTWGGAEAKQQPFPILQMPLLH